MPNEERNIGASVRAKLLKRSRAENSDYQVLLTRYALERLLYRLSVSNFREVFVLKGALLFAVWIPDTFRPTRDLDLLGFGSDNPQPMAETFKAICLTEVPDDGVAYDTDALTASAIREHAEYGGVRIRTQATIDGARVTTARNQRRKDLFVAQDEVEAQREGLIADIEGKLKQQQELVPLFSIRWSIV